MTSGTAAGLVGKPIHEALKPIQWLIGKWQSEDGSGKFPNIEPFSYCEDLEFSSVGQPILNYSSSTWHPQKRTPMHLETGFLRIKPGTQKVAFLVAHNFGLTTVEEGEVKDNAINLVSTNITRMSFAKDPEVTKIVRSLSLKDSCTLEQIVLMETSKTPLSEHLRVIYKKMQ